MALAAAVAVTACATDDAASKIGGVAMSPPATGQSKQSLALKVPPPSSVNPRQMMGMKPSDLLVLLGAPTLKRREPPAEVWQYLVRACVLHVFLFRNASDQEYHVAHVESLPRAVPDVNLTDCFARLLDRAAESDT